MNSYPRIPLSPYPLIPLSQVLMREFFDEFGVHYDRYEVERILGSRHLSATYLTPILHTVSYTLYLTPGEVPSTTHVSPM